MPMVCLRNGGSIILLEPLEGPDNLTPSPKCCRELTNIWTYRSVLIITDRSSSPSNQNGPMMPFEYGDPGKALHRGQALFRLSAYGVSYPRRCFPQSCPASSENQTLSRQSHIVNFVAKLQAYDHSLLHNVRCKLQFNRNPVSIQVEICNRIPHRLPLDSKLLTSPTLELAWDADNRDSDVECS